MAAIDRARDLGKRNAMRLRQQLATDLRDARLAAGVSQRHVAMVAGTSQSAISRVESARNVGLALDVLSVQCAALGLRLSVKLYPVGSPVRDAGQLRLNDRLLAELRDGWKWATEVLVGAAGDLRAWDIQLSGSGTVGIDAETRLHDIQAIQRRCEAKLRDSGVDRVVLLVADTRHNRSVLAAHRDALRSTFPADTAATLGALRRGKLPARNGIVIL
jgi:transcriptional regulator with XRE-family HTH domain